MRKFLHFEGLRGFAAFVVFLAHFRPTFCLDINDRFLNFLGITGGTERVIVESFIRLFYEGTLPVFIFWFMSAYVISIKLFDRKKNENNKYLVEASTKRYFRLAIPVFFSSLLCFILMKSGTIYNSALAEQLGAGYKDGWLNQQYHFSAGMVHFLRTTLIEAFMNSNCNYNFALWTMTPELLGSFLCFGLFAFVGKNRYRFVIYLAAILFLGFGGIRELNYQFYLMFVAGIMWCDSMHSNDHGIFFKYSVKKIFNSIYISLALVVISFAATIYSEAFHALPVNLLFFFAYPLKAIAITMLINNSGAARKFFSTKILTFLGKISFALYLLHLPIMFSVGSYLYLYAGIATAYKLAIVFTVLTSVTIVASWLFTKYIDNGAIKISDKIGKFFSSQNSSPVPIAKVREPEIQYQG